MKVGDPIPLQSQTADYSTGYFPQAFVKDAEGNDLDDSPFDLTDEDGTGFYTNRDAVMPDSPWVSVNVKFYSDSDHALLSTQIGGTDYDVYLSSAGDNFPPSSNILGIVEPDGCSQSPIQDTVVQGADRTLTVRLIENDLGNPFNLTGASLLEFRFRNADGTVLSVKSTDAGEPVQIVSAEAGKLLCVLTAAQTALLAALTPSPFSIVVTQPVGKTIVNLPSQLAVEETDV